MSLRHAVRYGQMQPTTWEDASDLVARVTVAVINEKGEDGLIVSAYDHGGAGGRYESTWGTGACPLWPGQPMTAHFVPDPVEATRLDDHRCILVHGVATSFANPAVTLARGFTATFAGGASSKFTHNIF